MLLGAHLLMSCCLLASTIPETDSLSFVAGGSLSSLSTEGQPPHDGCNAAGATQNTGVGGGGGRGLGAKGPRLKTLLNVLLHTIDVRSLPLG